MRNSAMAWERLNGAADTAGRERPTNVTIETYKRHDNRVDLFYAFMPEACASMPEIGMRLGIVRELAGGMNSSGATSEIVARWPLDLARCELFRDLRADRLADLQRQCRCARFNAGDMILAGEGNDAHNVFVILQGTAEVLRRSPFGELVILATLHSGMYFGEFSAIDGRSGSATVRASSDALLAEIPREVFRLLLRDEPAMAWRMMERLVYLIRCLDTRIAGLHGCHEEIDRIHRELFIVNL